MVTNEYFKRDGGLKYDDNKDKFPIDEVAASTIEKIDGNNQNMHNVRMQENTIAIQRKIPSGSNSGREQKYK